MKLILERGPVIAGVKGSAMQFYSPDESGYINNCPATSPEDVDHAVLVIGWTRDHWIVKNSMGNWWGNNGYAYISRSNNCGLKHFVDSVRVEVEPIYHGENTGNNAILTIKLKDAKGDGWNNNVLGLRQDGRIVAVFGEEFTTGKDYGPITVPVKYGKWTDVVVANYGSKTDEMQFVIIDAEGKKLIEHKSGNAFSADTILGDFCLGCTGQRSDRVSFFVTLIDSAADGWNGNQLMISQGEDMMLPFGGAFSTGSRYGPIKVELEKNMETRVEVFKYGFYSEEIGYTIRDENGNLVASRNPGRPISPD